MKILLVDDDEEFVELLRYGVRRAGLRPIVAFNGPSALQLLEEQQPDLVVLDVGLGEVSGLDVLRTIRRSHGHALPVIMLSAFDSEDDKVRALELGADDYVTKPFAFRELVARIRARLRAAAWRQAGQRG
jgi:DNA-binding response OmpR family regulator